MVLAFILVAIHWQYNFVEIYKKIESYYVDYHLKRITSPDSSGWINGKKGIVVLGDSISHGAFVSNIQEHGWVRMLSRHWQSKSGTSSYGFVPMMTVAPGTSLESRDVNSINFTNVGSGWKALSHANAMDFPNGFAMRSSNPGNKISVSIPNFQDGFIVHHANQLGGGKFNVYSGGERVASVDTGTNNNKLAHTRVTFNKNPSPHRDISLQIIDANPVDILGFSYVSDKVEPIVQNMSQSGRRLRYISAKLIDNVFHDSAVVIVALGQNDFQESGEEYKKETRAVIDGMIESAKKYNTDIIVPDFCWTATKSNWLRVELARLASETGGVYIPYPDIIAEKNNNTPTDVDVLVSKMKMWVDGSHPNKLGNEFIYEQFIKFTGW